MSRQSLKPVNSQPPQQCLPPPASAAPTPKLDASTGTDHSSDAGSESSGDSSTDSSSGTVGLSAQSKRSPNLYPWKEIQVRGECPACGQRVSSAQSWTRHKKRCCYLQAYTAKRLAARSSRADDDDSPATSPATSPASPASPASPSAPACAAATEPVVVTAARGRRGPVFAFAGSLGSRAGGRGKVGSSRSAFVPYPQSPSSSPSSGLSSAPSTPTSSEMLSPVSLPGSPCSLPQPASASTRVADSPGTAEARAVGAALEGAARLGRSLALRGLEPFSLGASVASAFDSVSRKRRREGEESHGAAHPDDAQEHLLGLLLSSAKRLRAGAGERGFATPAAAY